MIDPFAFFPISNAAFSTACLRRPPMKTCAPFSTKAFVIIRPLHESISIQTLDQLASTIYPTYMPVPPPVTRITFPSTPNRLLRESAAIGRLTDLDGSGSAAAGTKSRRFWQLTPDIVACSPPHQPNISRIRLNKLCNSKKIQRGRQDVVFRSVIPLQHVAKGIYILGN